MRSLAELAGVAYTTVSRIEHGQIDPTVGMLARLLEATGHDLSLASAPADFVHLADLSDAWLTNRTGQDRPDWTRLRAFVDQMQDDPQLVGPATAGQPAPSGSPLMDNLLAALAEKACDDAGLPRPRWVRRIRPLEQPWATPGTPRMLAKARAATPPQFARRGITIDVESLWREPATVGR